MQARAASWPMLGMVVPDFLPGVQFAIVNCQFAIVNSSDRAIEN
jgi:hypothetical protein